MRLIKHVFLMAALFGLMGCATNSETIKYYSFNLNDNLPLNKGSFLDPVRVVVGPIKLAKFLSQDNMVMQIGEHEIYKANYHRWAEPLDHSMIKQLVQQLNNRASERYQFVKIHGNASFDPILKLSLEIDQFHATDNGKVILSGNYWIVNDDKSYQVMQNYTFSDQLSKDGYQHTVEKLKGLLSQLADQIMESLR